jgi:virulence factor Mce-like protein
MRLSTRAKAGIGAVALCCSVFVTAACSLGPNDLPSVQGGLGSSYGISLVFASAMNLPTGADVTMDGLRVGRVESVRVSNQAVTVGIQLKQGTRVPSGVDAVIQQDTLLGDTYIALNNEPNIPVTGYLRPGATVPVSRTTSPPQLEDTMAVLAYFVNGGSIQKIEDTMTGINTVMPALPEVQNMASVVSRDLGDLSRNTGHIDRMLNGFNATSMAIDAKGNTLDALFSQATVPFWQHMAVDIVSYVATVLPSIGSIFEGGMWLVPMLDALATDGGELREIYDVAASDKLTSFLRTTLAPYIEHPSVNIRSVQAANGDQVIGDVENLLRMLGAVK